MGKKKKKKKKAIQNKTKTTKNKNKTKNKAGFEPTTCSALTVGMPTKDAQ